MRCCRLAVAHASFQSPGQRGAAAIRYRYGSFRVTTRDNGQFITSVFCCKNGSSSFFAIQPKRITSPTNKQTNTLQTTRTARWFPLKNPASRPLASVLWSAGTALRNIYSSVPMSRISKFVDCGSMIRSVLIRMAMTGQTHSSRHDRCSCFASEAG